MSGDDSLRRLNGFIELVRRAEIEKLRSEALIADTSDARMCLLEQQLVAMTNARDAACDLIIRMLDLVERSPVDFSAVRARVAEIKAVGQ